MRCSKFAAYSITSSQSAPSSVPIETLAILVLVIIAAILLWRWLDR